MRHHRRCCIFELNKHLKPSVIPAVSVEPTELKPGESPEWAIKSSAPEDFPWKRSRSGLAVFFFFSLLAGCSLLRLILLLKFGRHETLSFETLLQIFFIGFHQDFLVALGTTLPLLFWLWILPDRWFGQWWHRIFFVFGLFVFWT